MHPDRAVPASPSSPGEPLTRIPIDVRRFPWVRRLAADYAYDFGAVAPFFSGNPADRGAWTGAIARTLAHPRRYKEVAAVVAAQQGRRGAPPAALVAAERLSDPRAVAVLTGQQAGLFGGPLFTLLKSITALKLADDISRAHDVPAVAIFWVEAEDHDWDEVRSCTLLDEALTPRTVALSARGGESVPVARIHLDDRIDALVDELASVLPETDFRAELIAGLHDAYAPDRGMVDAFSRWLERLMGPRGLVVYDAADPASKPLASPVFARELSVPGRTTTLAARAGSELSARGYHSQVQANDGGLALFRLDGGRRTIRQQNGEFVVGDQHVPAAALVRAAEEDPTGFSPNVLLRPIVQDTLFPTVCYVAGPSELAYLGQLRGVYEHFGVPMPLMHTRLSATLLDSAAMRFLARYDLPLEALQPQDEAALNDLLRSQIPPAVEASLSAAGEAVAERMTRVIEEVTRIDPTLEGAARSTLGRMQHDLETLHGKMIQAAKRRDETLRRQFSRARALAFPDGHIQERTIGLVWFLNRYGPALVDRLSELPLDMGRHWVVSI